MPLTSAQFITTDVTNFLKNAGWPTAAISFTEDFAAENSKSLEVQKWFDDYFVAGAGSIIFRRLETEVSQFVILERG